jgi:hypothetical protein
MVGIVGNALERRAVQQVIDRARAAGVAVPDEVAAFVEHAYSGGGVAWAAAHPDDDTVHGCCWGEVVGGARACLCWQPVFDVEQAPPQPAGDVAGLPVRERMCGDCAYRPGSPERAEGYAEECLLALPADGELFFCHSGMRRPTHWEHPDGRTVPASDADYQPPVVGGVPYRADGRPGLLCAGWAAIAGRSTARTHP